MPRRVYSLTKAGRRALDAWLEEPDEAYEVRDEGLLKLFFGDLMPDEQRLDLIAPPAGLVRGVGGALPPDRRASSASSTSRAARCSATGSS